MAEQHLQAKLISLLKENNIKLWNPPYTTDSSEAGHEHMQELAVRYSQVVGFPLPDVAVALEDIRSQAVQRGEGNKIYRETNVATLEVILPKEGQSAKKKQSLSTKLDITTQELMNMITEKFQIKYMKLILNGKTLSPDKKLGEQKVKNHSKIMVLKVSEPEGKEAMMEVEKKRRLNAESVQRTQKGFQILSERDGSEDPETTPFLEIADQKGNPIQIPSSEKKALILAMGFHEKGRALMKRKEYDAALSHLLQADEQFSKCGSALLNMVDNYAVLQLDILWCYRGLEALQYLDDAKQRLQTAENCFLKCYGGEKKERLKKIKGTTGGEEVLFLRLYLLESLLTYLEGKGSQAAQKLKKAEELYHDLCLDPEKMTELMTMGFSEQEARLGLRACRGNMEEAVQHIMNRSKEREDTKRMEREKRRKRLEAINTLVELGYNKKSAAKALHETKGDLDEAYRYLLDSGEISRFEMSPTDTDKQTKVDQVAYLGFQREEVETALMLMGDDVAQATQLLLDNQGVIPPELCSPSAPSSSSDEPSTSSEDSTASGSSSLETELVNEVLEDIPRHEEDYLDMTLEEESEFIAQIKSYLESSSPVKKHC